MLLNRGQAIGHYLFVFIFLLPPTICTIYLLLDSFKPYNTQNDFSLATAYVSLLSAFYFYIIQSKQLKFKCLPLTIESTIFEQAILDITQKLKWKLHKSKNGLYILKSGIEFKTWGQLITILWNKDKIFFNSINDPDKKPSITSFGKNRTNENSFEQLLKQYLLDL